MTINIVIETSDWEATARKYAMAIADMDVLQHAAGRRINEADARVAVVETEIAELKKRKRRRKAK